VVKGLKSVHQLKDETVLEGWLFSILHNCWRDHFRRQHPTVDIDEALELAAPDKSPEEQHADSELIRRVRRAVAMLPLGQRQVVSLVDLEELSYTEAATALDIPIGTVMSRLCRARQALRVLLHEAPAAVHLLNPKARSGS
jgi:RNA polymerase sigma-70 factor, ECF subfamily